MLGLAGTGLAFVTVTILHLEVAVAGVGWLLLGIIIYVLYRRQHGLDLRTTALALRPERPPEFAAIEYRTALVPMFGSDVSASAFHSAAKLIGEDGVVYAVFVLTVPSQLSLEARLEDEEAQGRSVLESARIQAHRAGIKIHTDLIRTRNPGASLVEEALRIDADVIYWSTLHAPAGEQRIGPTAAYLLSKRPCRVIIETDNRPAAAREGAAVPACAHHHGCMTSTVLSPRLLKSQRPPRLVGLLVAAGSVALATALIYPLKQSARNGHPTSPSSTTAPR